MKTKMVLGTFLLLCFLAVATFPATTMANGLDFKTEKVYFTDSNTLAIEGGFYGISDDRPIGSTYKVFVDLDTEKGWVRVPGYAVSLGVPKPGRQTLYIYDVDKIAFSAWKTSITD